MKQHEIEIKLKEVQTILNQINTTQSGKLCMCAKVVDKRRIHSQFTTSTILEMSDLIIYNDPYGISIPFKHRDGIEYCPRVYSFKEKLSILLKLIRSYWRYL